MRAFHAGEEVGVLVAMAVREKRSSVLWDVLEPGAVGDSRTLVGLLRRKRRAGEDPGSVPLRTLGTQGVTRTPAREAAGASGRNTNALLLLSALYKS